MVEAGGRFSGIVRCDAANIRNRANWPKRALDSTFGGGGGGGLGAATDGVVVAAAGDLRFWLSVLSMLALVNTTA